MSVLDRNDLVSQVIGCVLGVLVMVFAISLGLGIASLIVLGVLEVGYILLSYFYINRIKVRQSQDVPVWFFYIFMPLAFLFAYSRLDLVGNILFWILGVLAMVAHRQWINSNQTLLIWFWLIAYSANRQVLWLVMFILIFVWRGIQLLRGKSFSA